jgi:hypothetical protein
LARHHHDADRLLAAAGRGHDARRPRRTRLCRLLALSTFFPNKSNIAVRRFLEPAAGVKRTIACATPESLANFHR